MTVPAGEGEEGWEPLLAKVAADTRSFPGGELLSQHYLAVRVSGSAALGVTAALGTALYRSVTR